VVIIRDLNDEGGFPSVPHLGSALERQIYFHCIRRDGSLDEDKYVTEMFNLPIVEGDSDSSSSSSDSDCVIIPRSSFTGNELVIFDPSTATMLTKSKFHSPDSIQTLRGAIKLSGSGKECDVIVEPVDVNDFATTVNLDPPHYFLMYGVVVKTFNLWFPFTPFVVSLLRTLNVAPVQLHPNSWGFGKAYQIICLALGLTPSIGVFFLFITLKVLPLIV
jgi:hypothetical protein